MIDSWQRWRRNKPLEAGRTLASTAHTLCLFVALSASSVQAREHRLQPQIAAPLTAPVTAALPGTALRRQQFLATVETLASEAMGGRKPGSPGGRLTTRYLAGLFVDSGLQPGADKVRYLQAVELTRYHTSSKISVLGSRETDPPYSIEPSEFVTWSSRRLKRQEFSGFPVFVGYGIRAPEYHWDDYRGLDVSGRIVVMLMGEPDIPEEVSHRQKKSRGQNPPRRFDPHAMTRHGRWDYKLELAARMGARAAVVLHDASIAGYPFSAVINTFGTETINLSNRAMARREPALSIWLSEAGSKRLLANAGLTPETLAVLAARGGRNTESANEGSELPLSLQIQTGNEWQNFVSHNVVGRLAATSAGVPDAGTTSAAPVILTAHWDHLGRLSGSGEKRWFPGAADNASGVAQMLDIARLLQTQAHGREVIIAALTAEESNLLGARAFVDLLLKPGITPLAAINLDVANIFGRARDVEIIGLGRSFPDDVVRKIAAAMGRTVSGDYAPRLGRLYRSDQYEFIRRAIPAVWIRGGQQRPAFAIRSPVPAIRRYLRDGYHQRGDTVQPWWDIDAALEDADLIAAIIRQLRSGADIPDRGRAPGR